MKRYYFDLRDGDALAPDEEGLTFGIEAAQVEPRVSLWTWPRTQFSVAPSMAKSTIWRLRCATETARSLQRSSRLKKFSRFHEPWCIFDLIDARGI